MRRIASRLTALGLLGLLTACNTAPVRDPNYAPVRPVTPPSAPKGDGAIYHGGFSMNWLEDLRARQVGDILTVTLIEQTNASKAASSSLSKSNSNSVTNPTLLGVEPQFGVPRSGNGSFDFSLESEHSFTGDGTSSQKNLLTGDITVTVTEVLSNGYLMIRGEKRIGINQGNEYIKLSGIVRPYDITADNRVESTKIADPTIVYVGDGMVAETNVMGWLARFFVGALMPF
jgi:flagellar L-ring protein precursor FlgH